MAVSRLRIRRSTVRISARLASAMMLITVNEYLAMNLIVPFARDMAVFFGVRRVGLGAASLTALSGCGAAVSAPVWGALSDACGRRPILLLSAWSSALSIAALGFAPTFRLCLVARFLGGLCNGLWCVLKSAVSDVVADVKGQSRAFALMVIAASTGAIFGPTLGGILAGQKGGERRPFALPCLVCAALQVTLATTGIALFPPPSSSSSSSKKKKKMSNNPSLKLKREEEEDPSSVSYAMPTEARRAIDRAVDGDTIEIHRVDRPRKLPFDDGLDDDGLDDDEIDDDDGLDDDIDDDDDFDDDDKDEAKEDLIAVYDVGPEESSSRRFKVAKEASTATSLVRAGALNALAALLQETAHVSEALILTSPAGDGGAGFTDSDAGLCFGAAGLLVLVWVSIGVPAVDRSLLRGSQRRLYRGAALCLAVFAMVLPVVAALPSSFVRPRLNRKQLPPIPLKELAAVVGVGGINAASSTAIISGCVLVQQALAAADPANLGKGNGRVQFGINLGYVVGPILAGLLFDAAKRLRGRLAGPGPFLGLAALGLLASDIASEDSRRRPGPGGRGSSSSGSTPTNHNNKGTTDYGALTANV